MPPDQISFQTIDQQRGRDRHTTKPSKKKRKVDKMSGPSATDKKMSSRLERLLSAKRKKRKAQKASTSSAPTTPTQPRGYTCMFCNKDRTHEIEIKDTSNYVALDCEFVGVGVGKISALGRCSVVDWNGHILCDVYARPNDRITDFRTPWSGIRPQHMKNAMPLEPALDIIRSHIEGKTVIGHAVHNDFHVMGIRHPSNMTTDTAKCSLLRRRANFAQPQPVSLKRLSAALLGRRIQTREHSSVEDARATMDLFKYSMSPMAQTSNGHCSNNNYNLSTQQLQRKSYMDDEYWPADL